MTLSELDILFDQIHRRWPKFQPPTDVAYQDWAEALDSMTYETGLWAV